MEELVLAQILKNKNKNERDNNKRRQQKKTTKLATTFKLKLKYEYLNNSLTTCARMEQINLVNLLCEMSLSLNVRDKKSDSHCTIVSHKCLDKLSLQLLSVCY